MRSTLVLLLSFSVLSGCSPADPPAGESAAFQAAAPAGPAAPPQRTAATTDAAAPAPASSVPLLAYSYAYSLAAQPEAIRSLVARHEAACIQAGRAACQLTGADVTEVGEDHVRGRLSLRATPAWLSRFRAGLAAEAQAAGGRIVNATVRSEDLSRQIVDTEAALRAKSTLRDRLQALLATRPGRLSELLELERELARIQGEIDATQSQLTAMRTRVATSELVMTYESAGVLAPDGVFAPLRIAAEEFVGMAVVGLATLVRIVAWLLPWALVLGAVGWVIRRLMRKRQAQRRPPIPAPGLDGA